MTDPQDNDATAAREFAERRLDSMARDPQRASFPEVMRPASTSVSRLAHELKTPLSAILAAAEIMRDARFGPLGDARYTGYASDIYDSAYHALSVINAMMDPGAAGATPPGAMAELDLNALVASLASSVRALIESVGLTLTVSAQPGLPHVIADPVSVRQILLNLITNAMRATPAGGTVAIATGYTLAGPAWLAVSDTGTGMVPSEFAAVVSGNGGAPSNAGLGIGLPLVRALAAANGGRVTIDSTPGHGTRVEILFAPDRIVPV
jgi:two-component system, cell cycle sensor histidine kinase PleC